MNVLINHCWCSDSNWGGHYDCRVIVSIYRVPEGKTYYDPPTEDWVKLITKHKYRSKNIWDGDSTYRLKPEVIEWLENNVKDRNGEKGWAVGTDKYNSNSLSFYVFFKMTSDALAFIKRWSVFGKPVDYLNYFKDIRRKLDLKTNRLKRVAR